MQTSSITSGTSLAAKAVVAKSSDAAAPATFPDVFAAAKGAPIIGFVDCALDTGFLGMGGSGQTMSIESIGANLTAAMPVFEGNLRRACEAYHIHVPPPLQLAAQPDGTLSTPPGDPRAAEVTTMYQQQPELARQYDAMMSAANFVAGERTEEAEKMVEAVYGHVIAEAALQRWAQQEQRSQNQFGIAFDGLHASLDERVGGTWRRPRSVAEIADEMVPGAHFVSVPSTIDAVLGAA